MRSRAAPRSNPRGGRRQLPHPGRAPSFTLVGAVAVGLLLLLALPSSGVGGGGGGPARRAFESQPDARYSSWRNIELAVERVEWKRSVVVEEYRDVVSEDREGSVTADARVRREVRGHG